VVVVDDTVVVVVVVVELYVAVLVVVVDEIVVVVLVKVVVVVVWMHCSSRRPSVSWYCPSGHGTHSKSDSAVPATETYWSVVQVLISLQLAAFSTPDHSQTVGSHCAHVRSNTAVCSLAICSPGWQTVSQLHTRSPLPVGATDSNCVSPSHSACDVHVFGVDEVPTVEMNWPRGHGLCLVQPPYW